jgi:hypothetical protein
MMPGRTVNLTLNEHQVRTLRACLLKSPWINSDIAIKEIAEELLRLTAEFTDPHTRNPKSDLQRSKR